MTQYHWIMTVEWPVGGGRGVKTNHGTTTSGPSESRGDVYQRLFALVRDQQPVPLVEPNVLFFSLELNRLEVV
ncbi:hypothetical protein ACWCPQ_14300 [Nocardia sp. NPDC001965]